VGVCFVLDYTQFQFDDLIFAALADPILVESGVTHSNGQPGYCSALRQQINKKVESVTDTRIQLEIRLSGNDRLIVPLDASSPPGPEMATLSGRGTFYNAWIRPD